MALSSLLAPEGVFSGVKANSKKQLVQELSAAIAPLAGLSERHVFETLIQRERLGSTGIGQGIAIPHGRMRGVNRLMGYFFKLQRPIDFESMDGEPVDLIFVLLAPEDAGADHLQALARVARVFRNSRLVQMLRQADERAALYAILTAETATRAA
jgi:PTS system nitrogen regulatory IIA component